jgi:hypothetical protein
VSATDCCSNSTAGKERHNLQPILQGVHYIFCPEPTSQDIQLLKHTQDFKHTRHSGLLILRFDAPCFCPGAITIVSPGLAAATAASNVPKMAMSSSGGLDCSPTRSHIRGSLARPCHRLHTRVALNRSAHRDWNDQKASGGSELTVTCKAENSRRLNLCTEEKKRITRAYGRARRIHLKR